MHALIAIKILSNLNGHGGRRCGPGAHPPPPPAGSVAACNKKANPKRMRLAMRRAAPSGIT